MNIAVYNAKGGVGKSTISVALAHYLDNPLVISNEPINPYYDNFPFYKYSDNPAGVEHDGDIVYDFGGFLAPEVVAAVKKSDLVIVPMNYDQSAIQFGVNIIAEIKDYGMPVIAAATMVERDDSTLVLDTIEDNFGDEINVISFRRVKLYRNALFEKKLPQEYGRANALREFSFKNALTELDQLGEIVSLLKEGAEQ